MNRLGSEGPEAGLEAGAEVGREPLAGAGDAGEVVVAQQPFVGRAGPGARLLSLRRGLAVPPASPKDRRARPNPGKSC